MSSQIAPSRGALSSLLISNLLALLGVLFFGWSVLEIIAVYWLETVFLGVLTLPRMAMAQGRAAEKISAMPFFVFHFGIFCVGHSVFAAHMFGPEEIEAGVLGLGAGPTGFFTGFFLGGAWTLICASLASWESIVAVVSFSLSHLYSFAANYIGHREYERTKFQDAMMRPYKRVGLLHVVVLLGAFLVTSMDAPAQVMAIFVVLKTGLDVWTHLREHHEEAMTRGDGVRVFKEVFFPPEAR